MQIEAYLVYLIGVLIVWLALLSLFVLRASLTLKKLTRGGRNLNLAEVLDGLSKELEVNSRKTQETLEQLVRQQNLQKSNFQKVSLVRFNPFEDTGGDQSFAVALLDGENNGIVISSLHSRNGTRVYAKEVLRGKSKLHQLSKEEKEVVEKATNINI